MSTAGSTIQDLLPIPDTTAPVTDPDKKEIAHSLEDEPTLSHALATNEQEEKGAVQQNHDEPVVNLGWNEPKENIENPLVGGIDNEDLWLLVRRFNKQTYHFVEIEHPAPGGLDLNVAEEEEFSPDKLRSNIERLYMTVIIGLLAFVKHIARLRSWRETRRTAWFCAIYFLAWMFDFLVPMLCSVFIALIVWPRLRGIMFPPAPLALVDRGIQKPKAGVLGSLDSATGAPEHHKGEAIEAEASNFVTGIASIALSSATGKHPQSEPPSGEGVAADAVPDPSAIALGAANAKNKAAGGNPTEKHDKTKAPMTEAMWTKMRPIMHGLAEVSDTWERIANALSPTLPFPREVYKLRLAAFLVPVLAASIFTTSYMFLKGATFGLGFAFFGDPVISRGIAWLNRTFPRWQKLLELRNTLLKGVPTNAQLTITLLRLGEANRAPLPPPPRVDHPPPDRPADVTDDHLRAAAGDRPLDASPAELRAAMAHDPAAAERAHVGEDIAAAKAAKHGKKGSRVLGFLRGTTKAAVETAIGADTVRAKAGSSPAKMRLGVVPRAGDDLVSGAPSKFKCRFHGNKGHVYVSASAAKEDSAPTLAFSTDVSLAKVGSANRDDLHPAWEVPVAQIRELKKLGGYGWKAKLVVGWSLEKSVQDGLEIVDRKGNRWVITACPLRDELFNRLCAMGGQKWEAF